ncbi:MAG: serine/threonine-protein phosphatase, partial [Chloroflexi bacterium]|nr:serine/threonine-protein phosphatase [Chloroflexota bacterium]
PPMNRIPRTDLIVGYQTHPGETGKNNEDRALLMAFQGAAGEKSPVTLAVVADGIGGHQAGEVASQIAVNTFTSLFTKTDSRSYLDLFAQGFATIAQGIVSHTTKNPDAAGMGTTCAAVVIANRRLYTAYIGDSRIYLIRNNTLQQITVDHTWVQEAIEHGVLTREQARKHPNRHVVRRHLGAQADATPDFRLQLSDAETPEAATRNQGMPLSPGDIVLLSSDGMTDLVEDSEILAAFGNQTPQAAVDALTTLARQRGGFDNITMIALQMPETANVGSGAAGRRSASGRTVLLLAAVAALGVLVAVLAMAIVGYFYFFNPFNKPLTPTATATSAPAATITPVPPSATLRAATLIADTPTILPPTATLTVAPTRPSATPTAALNPTLFTPTPTGTGGP